MAEASTRQLMEDLRAVVADAEALLSASADEAGAGLREARERAAESLGAARARLAELEEDLKTRAREAAGQADRYVRDNPWQSIGVAAAVGFVAGLLIARR
jgi:ElaB/YqjD/DUF883 family membrane-anchored ribosome-binding protein